MANCLDFMGESMKKILKPALKYSILMLNFILCIFFLTNCVSKAENASSSVSEEEKEESVSSIGELIKQKKLKDISPISLRFVYDLDMDKAEGLEGLVRVFNAGNDYGIEVELVRAAAIDWAAYNSEDNEIRLPDMVLTDASGIKGSISSLTALDSYFEEFEIDKNNFYESLISQVSDNNSVYGVPLLSVNSVVYYNKALLEENAAEGFSSIDELLETAEIVKEKEDIALIGTADVSDLFESFYIEAANELAKDISFIKNNEFKPDRDVTKKALEKLFSACENGYINVYSDYESMHSDYKNKNIAGYVSDSSDGYYEELESVATSAYMTPVSGKGIKTLYSGYLGVTAKDENTRKACMELISYLIGSHELALFDIATAYQPVKEGSSGESEYKTYAEYAKAAGAYLSFAAKVKGHELYVSELYENKEIKEKLSDILYTELRNESKYEEALESILSGFEQAE